MTPSPASGETSSWWSATAWAGPGRRPASGSDWSRRSPVSCRSTMRMSSSPPAWVCRWAGPAIPPKDCCATPTRPCTAPRRRAGAGSSCSTPTPGRGRPAAWQRRGRCGGPWSAKSSACSTSRSSPWPTTGSSAPRRSSAGTRRGRRGCRRPTSSRSLRRRGSSCRSVSGCWTTHATSCAAGMTSASTPGRSRSTSRPVSCRPAASPTR